MLISFRNLRIDHFIQTHIPLQAGIFVECKVEEINGYSRLVARLPTTETCEINGAILLNDVVFIDHSWLNKNVITRPDDIGNGCVCRLLEEGIVKLNCGKNGTVDIVNFAVNNFLYAKKSGRLTDEFAPNRKRVGRIYTPKDEFGNFQAQIDTYRY